MVKVSQVTARTRRQQLRWFLITGHCGKCGNPGGYCTCTVTDPCPCSKTGPDPHKLGSARDKDALEAFTEPVLVVPAEQEALF